MPDPAETSNRYSPTDERHSRPTRKLYEKKPFPIEQIKEGNSFGIFMRVKCEGGQVIMMGRLHNTTQQTETTTAKIILDNKWQISDLEIPNTEEGHSLVYVDKGLPDIINPSGENYQLEDVTITQILPMWTDWV